MLDVGPFHLGEVELLWLGINVTTLALTVYALRDALRDRDVVALKNGRVREIATAGNVRNEKVRLEIQAVLLAMALGSYLSDRPVSLFNPLVIGLFAVSLLLLFNTIGDLLDRRRITAEFYREKP